MAEMVTFAVHRPLHLQGTVLRRHRNLSRLIEGITDGIWFKEELLWDPALPL